jgi:hypothetical protein
LLKSLQPMLSMPSSLSRAVKSHLSLLICT